jgi:adenylate cyclase
MDARLEQLTEMVEGLKTTADEKETLLQLIEKIKKEISIRNFELDRAKKAKITLNTLLARTSEDLEKSTELIKKMFGRYLSTEVMNSLLEDPSALEMGGEKRKVTIMMTDLRGFTALSERLKPEEVVKMLNAYFEVMMDVILKYQGTINEIIGDALLVIFGAPQEMADRAGRAIACAIDMQNAMAKVNAENRPHGLPTLEMGIGLNETEVIVGNIGSSKRSKYAVVGSGVNMTSRIESYTIGGQILISESVHEEVGDVLHVLAQRDILPKGVETPLRVYEVGGIGEPYNLALQVKEVALVKLARQIPLRYVVLEGKSVEDETLSGTIIQLSQNGAQLRLETAAKPLTNLKMGLVKVDEKLSTRHFYGKVFEGEAEEGLDRFIRFTSVPPEIDAYFQAHLQHAMETCK